MVQSFNRLQAVYQLILEDNPALSKFDGGRIR
jgi:hypothetical protein